MADSILVHTSFPDLKLLSKGKVRDVYATSSPDALLFVATDRISAYDVVLKNVCAHSNPSAGPDYAGAERMFCLHPFLKTQGIPGKGKILTALSLFWFNKLSDVVPNHLITTDVDQMPEEVKKYKDILEGRSMLVRSAQVIPIEAIVRGYITGAIILLLSLAILILNISFLSQGGAWKEYKKSGTVHGIPLPEGLEESGKLPHPLFTPSTKAEQGAHDENIHPDQGIQFFFSRYLSNGSFSNVSLTLFPNFLPAAELIGADLAGRIGRISLDLYSRAAEFASTRGIILADTKFEFGLVPSSPHSSSEERHLILIDEVLTPDSSRYWPAASYEPGKSQASFDKQYLRDWMVSEGFKTGLEDGKDGEGWFISDAVVQGTATRYAEALHHLTS